MITITRSDIECDGGCPEYDDTLYPETGHRCEWSRYGLEARCEDQATNCLHFSDGYDILLVCAKHADEEEANAADTYRTVRALLNP